MATIGIRQSAWDSGTADQRRVLKVFADFVDVGEVALYKTGSGQVWLIADDWRISTLDAAVFGKILGLLAQFNVIPNGDVVTRQRLKTWITNHGGNVLPEIPDGEDPYDYTYTQNGGPAFGAARSSVPPGLTPMEASFG